MVVSMSSHIDNIDYSRCHDLTIKEIKSCKQFSHLSDQDAEEVLNSIKTLAELAFRSVLRDKKVNKSIGNSSDTL